MMNEYINLTLENIDEKYICYAIGDHKHQNGVDRKKEWIKSKLKDGHVFRKLNARGKIFIEYESIETDYRNNGIGKRLLEKAIKELGIPVYTISKVDNFYLKNGWTYDNTDLIGEECKKCKEYNENCFPRVIKYEII